MKRKREFKREYVPVVIASILLVLLVIALIFAIFYDKEDFDINVPEENGMLNEILVDTSESLCDSKTIQKLYNQANDVKVTYKPVKKVTSTGVDLDTNEDVEVESYVYEVTISNITEDIYLIIKNDNIYFKDIVKTIKYADTKKGKYVFTTDYTELLVTYEVSVYSAEKSCKDELYRKFTFITPIYNRFYDMYTCVSYPDFKWCQQFITEDVPSYQEFQTELKKYAKSERITTTNIFDSMHGTTTKKAANDKTDNNDKNNKKESEGLSTKTIIIVSIIGGLVILIVIVTSVILIGRRKK